MAIDGRRMPLFDILWHPHTPPSTSIANPFSGKLVVIVCFSTLMNTLCGRGASTGGISTTAHGGGGTTLQPTAYTVVAGCWWGGMWMSMVVVLIITYLDNAVHFS